MFICQQLDVSVHLILKRVHSTGREAVRLEHVLWYGGRLATSVRSRTCRVRERQAAD